MSSDLTPEVVFDALSRQLQKHAAAAFDERQEEREEDRRAFSASLDANNAMLASLQESLATIALSLATPTVAAAPVAPTLMVPSLVPSMPTNTTAPAVSTSLVLAPTPGPPTPSVPPLLPTLVPQLVPGPPLVSSHVLPLAPDQDNRICRSEKMSWSKCPSTDDTTTIQGWRMKFLSAVNNCDLQDLYDPVTHDLVRSHPNAALVTRLCNSLTQSLPDSHPLLLVSAYYREGLLLWHAFSATVLPVITYHKRQELIKKLVHQTTRLPTEDVFTYYNRLTVDADYINKGMNPPAVSKDDFRRCFLFSLGTEFDFLRQDDIEGRLDQSYIVSDIEPLLQRLQGILHTKRSTPNANAVVPAAQMSWMSA
jgi:hypothetical protein